MLVQYESVILYIFQAFALLALAGLALSFRQHRNIGPLIVGVLSCGALAYHFYQAFSLATLYGGFIRFDWGNTVELSEQQKSENADSRIDN